MFSQQNFRLLLQQGVGLSLSSGLHTGGGDSHVFAQTTSILSVHYRHVIDFHLHEILQGTSTSKLSEYTI